MGQRETVLLSHGGQYCNWRILSKQNGQSHRNRVPRAPRRYIFIRVCSMARVWRSTIHYNSTGPNQVPPWQGQPRQYAPVWVRIKPGAPGKPNIVKELSYQEHSGMVKGCLVITGNAPHKKKEFVFLLPKDDAEEIHVSDDIINRFHDDDQLTQWQEDAFPTDQ